MSSLRVRLAVAITVVLALFALLLSMRALGHFKRDLPPEMARTVAAVGYSASEVVGKAYLGGVPLAEMVGVPEYLGSLRNDNPGIAFIVLADNQGHVLFGSGHRQVAGQLDLGAVAMKMPTIPATDLTGAFFTTSMPLEFNGVRLGTLHLGQSATLVEQRLQEVFYDVLTVLVVAGLIALELLRFVLTFVIATPAIAMRDFLQKAKRGDFSTYLPFEHLGGIGQLSAAFNGIVGQLNSRYQRLMEQARHADLQSLVRQRFSHLRFHAPGERRTLFVAALDLIRWPFFLLVFADSLSLSFFPVFVGQFYSPDMGVSRNFVVGLPISVFMFTWALSMPWAGMFSDRVGHRRAFLVGASVTTAGLVLTACAHSLYDLLLWRCLTALGYGLVFITTQSYVTNHTPAAQRTRSMAVFLSTFFAGSLSGSAIGGILADRLGYNSTILLSAFLSGAAALFVLRFLLAAPVNADAGKRRLTLQDFRLLLKHPKFLAVTLLAAVPAKLALTGFLYYAVPLYLKLLGNSQSTTGRVMMAYGLAIIVLSPVVAKIADRLGKLRWFVVSGGYLAALSMFIVYYVDSTIGLLSAITLLGVAHSIGVSPQMALINDFCKDVVQQVGNGTATGIFRLIERLGNVLGPILAGLLISQFGFNGAFAGIGIVCLTCTTSFTVMLFWFDNAQSRLASRAG